MKGRGERDSNGDNWWHGDTGHARPALFLLLPPHLFVCGHVGVLYVVSVHFL